MPVDNPRDRASCSQANSHLTPRITRFHPPLRVGCGEVVIPVCWGASGATADPLLTRCVKRRPAGTYIVASPHNPDVSCALLSNAESASTGKPRVALRASRRPREGLWRSPGCAIVPARRRCLPLELARSTHALRAVPLQGHPLVIFFPPSLAPLIRSARTAASRRSAACIRGRMPSSCNAVALRRLTQCDPDLRTNAVEL